MNGDFNIALWEVYASGISKNLPDKLKEDIREYNFDTQILPVILQTINNRGALEELHNAFIVATANINDRCRQIFQLDLNVYIILYLGLCNGAGWATTLDDKKVVLLGVEKIIELNWHDEKSINGLICHEIGHILHDVKRGGSLKLLNQRDKSIWQLWREGIAMYCEQLLNGDFSHYHQNRGDWLEWCVSNHHDILYEYKRRLYSEESTQDFFGDWTQWQGRSDLGYFLGCEFVKSLAQRYKLNELLSMGISEIKKEFDRYAI